MPGEDKATDEADKWRTPIYKILFFWRILRLDERKWMKKTADLVQRRRDNNYYFHGGKRKLKGSGKGTRPKFLKESQGPHEPDGGPNPGGLARNGRTIAVRACRALTDPEILKIMLDFGQF